MSSKILIILSDYKRVIMYIRIYGIYKYTQLHTQVHKTIHAYKSILYVLRSSMQNQIKKGYDLLYVS